MSYVSFVNFSLEKDLINVFDKDIEIIIRLITLNEFD